METIKIVLGFVELAFSLKFLSVADLAYGWHIMDREVFLALWIVSFGAYATANPVVVSFVSYIGVFFNALWGFVIFGEILTGLTVAGGVLIIGGSMYLTKLKHDKIAEMAKMQERK